MCAAQCSGLDGGWPQEALTESNIRSMDLTNNLPNTSSLKSCA